MTAFTRLAAWLRSSRDQADRPGDDAQWRDWLNGNARQALTDLDTRIHELHLHDLSKATTPALRLVDILQHAARWRAELDETRIELEAARLRVPPQLNCSCSGGIVVVIHNGGSYCGDQQADRLTDVLYAHHPQTIAESERAATAVLDTLRGDHRG